MKLDFKSFYIENFLDPQNKYSWQSPMGSFHPVPPRQTHEMFAKQMYNNDPHAAYYLFKDGWGRITHSGRKLYFNNQFFAPSSTQKRNLVDFAISNGFDQVLYDNERNQPAIIWEKD